MQPPSYFHHSMRYPDGTLIHGKLNHQVHLDWLQLREVPQCSVLDIAANDGFFAFWAEWYGGASRVVAIDVDTYDKYDWGPAGPPAGWQQLKQQNKREAFDFHHHNTNSQVERLNLSVYDLCPNVHGSFDIVFNFGLLYHLRNPVLSLDKCRTVCKGFMFLETAVFQAMPKIAMSVVANADTGLATVTDSHFPTEACVLQYLKHSGFEDLYYEVQPMVRGRQRFIAVVDTKWLAHMDANPFLRKVDAGYWQQVAQQTQALAQYAPA